MDRRKFLQYAALASAAGVMPNSVLANANFINQGTSSLSKQAFGSDFKWGVATAAYQIEGAHNIDGRGPSIWDTFSQKSKNIKDKSNGNVSCDFYHNYHSDLELLHQMNFDVFRFSLSWSRILPDGIGSINQKGIDFYHRVIDRCLELNIEPWITLYHWDLPQALENKKGWLNRDVVDWFTEYADLVTRTYGDKVKNWMVLNEPMAYTALGYFMGAHAPGKIGGNKFLKATHHTCLVQAGGGRIIRNNVKNAYIGTTISCSAIDAKNDKKKHNKAETTMEVLLNRLFIEPALGMGYPTDGWKYLNKIERHMQAGDEDKLSFDFDFIGLQNYTRMVAKKGLIPYVWSNQVKPEKRGISKEDITEMGWEVYPEGIYRILKQFGEYEGIKEIIVTENGCAFPDVVSNDGAVHDPKRLAFYKAYLKNVLKAKQEGVNIKGYFAWTLMDNFEWAEGYGPRFGLIHVDYKTQKRIIKDTGLWFKEFLKE